MFFKIRPVVQAKINKFELLKTKLVPEKKQQAHQIRIQKQSLIVNKHVERFEKIVNRKQEIVNLQFQLMDEEKELLRMLNNNEYRLPKEHKKTANTTLETKLHVAITANTLTKLYEDNTKKILNNPRMLSLFNKKLCLMIRNVGQRSLDVYMDETARLINLVNYNKSFRQHLCTLYAASVVECLKCKQSDITDEQLNRKVKFTIHPDKFKVSGISHGDLASKADVYVKRYREQNAVNLMWTIIDAYASYEKPERWGIDHDFKF